MYTDMESNPFSLSSEHFLMRNFIECGDGFRSDYAFSTSEAMGDSRFKLDDF